MYAPMDYILCVFTYRFILVNTSSVESKKKGKKEEKGGKMRRGVEGDINLCNTGILQDVNKTSSYRD